MNFTKVHNPTDKEVALQFQGEIYTIGANKSEEFPISVATQWITIYGFMSIVEAKDEPKIVIEKTVEPITKPKVATKK